MAYTQRYNPAPTRSRASNADKIMPAAVLMTGDVIGGLIAVFDPDGAELDPIRLWADKHLPGRMTANDGTIRLTQAGKTFGRLLGGMDSTGKRMPATLMDCVIDRGHERIFNPQLLRQVSHADACRAIEDILRRLTDGWRECGRELALTTFAELLTGFVPVMTATKPAKAAKKATTTTTTTTAV